MKNLKELISFDQLYIRNYVEVLFSHKKSEKGEITHLKNIYGQNVLEH